MIQQIYDCGFVFQSQRMHLFRSHNLRTTYWGCVLIFWGGVKVRVWPALHPIMRRDIPYVSINIMSMTTGAMDEKEQPREDEGYTQYY